MSISHHRLPPACARLSPRGIIPSIDRRRQLFNTNRLITYGGPFKTFRAEDRSKVQCSNVQGHIRRGTSTFQEFLKRRNEPVTTLPQEQFAMGRSLPNSSCASLLGQILVSNRFRIIDRLPESWRAVCDAGMNGSYFLHRDSEKSKLQEKYFSLRFSRDHAL